MFKFHLDYKTYHKEATCTEGRDWIDIERWGGETLPFTSPNWSELVRQSVPNKYFEVWNLSELWEKSPSLHRCRSISGHLDLHTMTASRERHFSHQGFVQVIHLYLHTVIIWISFSIVRCVFVSIIGCFEGQVLIYRNFLDPFLYLIFVDR